MIYKLLPTRVHRAYYGGENLDIMEGKKDACVSRFPEDWLASVTTAFNPDRNEKNEGLSKTISGELLKDIIEKNKSEMIGDRNNMSLLFKLLDSAERLVIQVHPTVEFAKKHFNSEYGKTECWYILNDGGEVFIGFKEGITKEEWMTLFKTQDIEGMLNRLHRFKVKKGDFIFVEGGVPHAIGKNCFLAELQEPTDLMVIPEKVTPSNVVLPDQKLHGGLGFEKMFDCFNYEGYDEITTRQKYFKNAKIVNENEFVLVDLDITDKFRLSQINVADNYVFKLDSYAVAVVIKGNVAINGLSLVKGDRIFISENEKELKLKGNAQILICRP